MSVLDIGAGTGLLSLMLAQRNDRIRVDAIEINKVASQQAQENTESSPWKNRVRVINADATTHIYSQLYDLVICNPPFFNNSLLGDNDNRNLARHTVSLSYPALWNVLNQVLKTDGYASIMFPVFEHNEWENLLNMKGWRINRRLCIHPKANFLPNRIVSLCSRTATEKLIEEEVVIYAAPNQYSPETSELLKPFYLRFKNA